MTVDIAPASLFPRLEPLLAQVSKPVQYIGGEVNSRPKEFAATLVRGALMSPDAYEVGQPNLGLAILYELLNERDYGDLNGLNKDDARAKWGEEQVLIWRRSYDVPPPGGESLKDTAARTLPYFDREILPLLKAGKTVLIAAHGNSLRSIVMAIENLTPEQILKREIATGEPVVYSIGADGKLEGTVAV